MDKPRLVVHKDVGGVVESNDGEVAEVQTYGTRGIEQDILLETIQIHREDTDYSAEEFQRTLPVASQVDVSTTTEVTGHAHPKSRT